MTPDPQTVSAMADYAGFLPSARRDSLAEPVSDWWHWKNHRIHMLRLRDATAPVRLLVVHGAGAHASALWPVASQLAGCGIDIAAVDMPLYGWTVTASRGSMTYGDWISLLADLLAAEDDGRPVVLLGASVGGMLAVEAGARARGVAAVIATCLLDPLDEEARAAMTRFGKAALPFLPLLRMVRGPFTRIPVKVSWVANLRRMGRDPGLGGLCARDRRGGAAWVPLGFLASFMHHSHVEARRVSLPVHLMHPELDDWTPAVLSKRTLGTLPGPATSRTLGGCGHFPLEEPGLQDLLDGIKEVAAAASAPLLPRVAD